MVVRQKGATHRSLLSKITFLNKHYISDIEGSFIRREYLPGRVQNVLLDMEAAFVDIGQHCNGVLYAGGSTGTYTS